MPLLPASTPVPIGLRAHYLAPALSLAMAAFLTQFDIIAIVVALPSIGHEFDFTVAGLAWVMDAYSVAFTAMLLIAGALADRLGRRRMLLGGNIVFALASLACGFAYSGPSLWAGRTLQGAAAAFVVTGAIALIADAYPQPQHRARAFALMGVVSGVAMALGPTLGGAIAAWQDWRWIFLINAPICVIIGLAVPRLVAESRESRPRALDPAGVVLLTLSLIALIVALLHARDASSILPFGLAASAGLAGAFVIQQRRRTLPLLDPQIFAQRAMIGIAALLVTLSVSYWAVLVYLPLYLLWGFEMASSEAGLIMLAATAPMLALPSAGGRLIVRHGWQRVFAAGIAIVALGDFILAATTLAPDGICRFMAALLGMSCIGIGAASVHPQLSSAVVTLVPSDRVGMAAAFSVALRQGGFCIGIAALGAVMPPSPAMRDFAAPFLLAALCSSICAIATLMLLPKKNVLPN